MNDRYNPRSAPPVPNRQAPRFQNGYTDNKDVKRQKAAAVSALGDKVAAVMRTNPILAVVGARAELISYIVTGASALLTILSMALNHFDVVLGYISLIFGFFALAKKRTLPLAAALSVLSLFKLVCFIGSVAGFALADSGAVFSSGFVISFVFSIVELTLLGYLSFLSWSYFAAALPALPPFRLIRGARPASPADKRGKTDALSADKASAASDVPEAVSENVSKSVSASDSAREPISETSAVLTAENGSVYASEEVGVSSVSDASVSENKTVKQASNPASEGISASVKEPPSIAPPPVLNPLVSVHSSPAAKIGQRHKFCAACGAENEAEAFFCRQCGHKF